MCATLGIQIIAASSPQAKGRVERNHGTHQDRLVKKLRRLGIQNAAVANAFLEATYLPEHHVRLAQPAASSEDFHRRIPSAQTLDAVFQLEETRVLSNDWVVRYATRSFQRVRQSGQPPARSTVVVREAPEGTLDIRYRDRVMRWTEIPAVPTAVGTLRPRLRRRLARAPRRGHPVAPARIIPSGVTRGRPTVRAPSAGRPWLNGDLWTLPERWTRGRAHRSLQNAPTRFAQRPQAISWGTFQPSQERGHF